jgi:hypothetical protein
LAVFGAILLLAVFAGKAPADMAFPGYNWQEPHLRFAGLENHPDYVFYLKYQSGPGNPGVGKRNAVRITSGEPFTLPETGRRRFIHTALVAVPRGSLPSADTDPDWEWLSEKTSGVLEARLDDNDLDRSYWITDPNNHYVTPYQVAIQEGRLEVTRLPLEGVLLSVKVALTARRSGPPWQQPWLSRGSGSGSPGAAGALGGRAWPGQTALGK